MDIMTTGSKCRHCDDVVKLRETKKRVHKPTKVYGFTHHLYCPTCKAIYMEDKYKYNLDGSDVKEQGVSIQERVEILEDKVQELIRQQLKEVNK